MGQRGPKPTPTAQLRMRGSWRADLNRAEPQPESGRPECPDWLGDGARQAWDQLIPQLEAMRVLTKIDGNALARYCELWVEWQQALAFVRKHGTTFPIKDGNGKLKSLGQFPQVALVSKLSLTLSRLESEFGMTPSARSRINVEPVRPPSDPAKARFFTSG